MKRLLKRLGRSKLEREAPAERERRGQRLDRSTHIGFLVPATNPLERIQLKELAQLLTESDEVDRWRIVADTGMTRKAHAKARAHRIQRLGEGQEARPEFPQLARVTCCWRDDCNTLGLPSGMLEELHEVDVLITLDEHFSSLPLLAMMRRSRAAFKVGPIHADDGTLDFMLTWPDGGDMSSFVQLAFHYLKTLDLK